MIEQAMPVRSGGKVCVSEFGDIKVHTYIRPGDGILTNAQIVEGPTKPIVFDGQFFTALRGRGSYVHREPRQTCR